jgi:hypothetical protein
MPDRRDPLIDQTSVIPAALQERPRKINHKKRSADRARSKATYDIPPDLAKSVETLAGGLKCSKSDIVTFAVADLLARCEAGTVDLQGHLQPHGRSPRFAFKLSRSDE